MKKMNLFNPVHQGIDKYSTSSNSDINNEQTQVKIELDCNLGNKGEDQLFI